MSTSTLEGLRTSKKGNLIYDKYWLEDGRVEDVVAYCSSPPSVSVDLLTAALSKTQIASPVREEQRESPETRQRRNDSITANDVEVDHNYSRRKALDTSPVELNESSNVERAIFQCEQEWEKIVKERVKERQWQLQEHSKQVQEQAEQNVALKAQQRELKQRAIVQMKRQAQREMDEMREKRLLHQQELQRLHVKRLDAKLKAAVQQREADEMEKRKRAKEQQDFQQSLSRVKSQVDEAAKKIVHLLQSCSHKEHLSKESSKLPIQIQALCTKADSLVHEASEVESFRGSERTMQAVVDQLMLRQEEAIRAIAEAERKFQEEVARKEKEKERLEKERLEKERQEKEKVKAKKSEARPEPTQPQPSSSSTTAVPLESCVSPDALNDYTGLQEKHKVLEESCKGLSKTTDKDVKKYRFDLQKAVNTPINSVSVQSGSHLLDKLHRIKDLLSGLEVQMTNRRVKATQPTGVIYVKDLAAKKLVKQGDEQVSSNHESAFAYAAIAVALWQDIPDMGDLFLYHFYQSSPFLVPYHMTKKDDQTLEEYYKSLGYCYESEGQIEKQDKYLKRMAGFTRLYAAIIATPPLRGQSHPHGVERGWMFISRVLNLEPQPDITATTLFDFLEVCGQALSEAYGKQFFKLLQTIYRNYFPKIEAVTPQGSGGPVMRLKSFLEDCLKRQRVPPPKGFLSSDFWRS
ncbi:nucleoporin GLE1 [Strongylocentrotus purpuratus]|uniref:mRNA export factor GLE1 n=1 Tax=Strongylocentrotus purpuratus TaxID=7668 RepID=A0A7M7HE52_STRPU|nr:nucleoporin GLE1 [Strongylocentrotus purpuratus]